MPKQAKKQYILKRFTPYMGENKILLPFALVFSGLSAALNILPYILVWYIVRNIFSDPLKFQTSEIGLMALLAFVAAISGVLFYFLALICSHLAAFRVEVGLQKVGMEKIRSLPLGFFDKHASGKIRKIINDGAGTTHNFLAHQLPDMAGSLVTPIILLILTFVVDWRMGLASLIPILMGFVTMSAMVNTKGKAFQKQYMDSLEEMSAESVEYVRGIPVVKTFGQSIFSFKKFYNSIIHYKDMVCDYTSLWRHPMSFYTVIMESTVFFLIPVAILLIGRMESLSTVVADFIFYIMIAPIFAMLLMRSMYYQQNAMVAEQAIDRIDELINCPPMVFAGNVQEVPDNSIEFRNVSFAYDGMDKKALNGVNFKIDQGQTLAIVGASGGGKTTIARLAARFWDVNEGEILLGGINIKDFSKQALMEKVSFVFQTTRLFKGTLRENIIFGKKNVDEKVINAAIDYSQSREIIDHLVDGLETQIGTKGTYLSGGEQQRIALARAMVKDAPIVLLDEATAFADPENEHLIQKALKEMSRGKTTLMIAHRLTTVQDADKILVIDKGQIVEEGSHQELMTLNGIYKNMWDEYQKSITWKISSQTSQHGGA